jgi:predicted RecB family nuclease
MGLKPVARWLGRKGRETGADAAMSMLWFDMWLSTDERSYLEASLRSNDDACRAATVVKEWLARVGAKPGRRVLAAGGDGHGRW